MKQRKLLGVVTCLTEASSLSILFLCLLKCKSYLHPEIAAYLVTIVIAFSGGILLWKGKRAGYYLSTVTWGLVLVGNLMRIIIVMNLDGFKLTFESDYDFNVYTKPFLGSVIHSVFALFPLFLLSRDLFFRNFQLCGWIITSDVEGSKNGGHAKPE